MRLMALLFAAVLLQTPQATTDPGFALRPGATGPFEVGSTVARVYAIAGREKTEHGVPDDYKIQLDTSKGPIVIAVHRKWAPRGADRFYELVTSGYYDDAPVFRIRKGTWAQFGIAADPKVAQAWRTRTIPDDPFVGVSNKRGTVAFAFKDPDGRTTQVFINLKDNSETHDKEPFVVFGEVVQGMGVADSLYAEYGERAGGGIRAGKQDPVFEGGNAYLKANFPLLDYIRTARVLPR
jgi:cyclophilin family peptidyl-prolyl cis-trans isomerase